MPSDRYDAQQIQTELQALNSKSTHAWAIEDDKLSKTYQFKDFVDAFGFMTRAALVIEKNDHHPEWFNVYKTVKVQLISHDVSGLSQRDFDLAHQLDRLAGERG